MTDYQMRKKPFDHQQRLWEETRDLEAHCAFWEQGTGKSKFIIDSACWQYKQGKIDALVIVAPNGVHSNWTYEDEDANLQGQLNAHVPLDIPWQAVTWHASKASTKTAQRRFTEVLGFDGLAVLSITYDAAGITDAGKKALWDFLKGRKVFMAVDESLRIGTPNAKRTKALIKAGSYAVSRRAATGTPVGNSPLSVYSQVRFADPDFWERELMIGSFTSFKAHFAVLQRVSMGGQSFDQIVDYRNLDQLQEVLKKIASRVVKSEVLDLPAKVYNMRHFQLSPNQRRIYDELKKDALAWASVAGTCECCQGKGYVTLEETGNIECFDCDGTGMARAGLVTAPEAITRLLRLQQVCCGYIQTDEGDIQDIEGPNPRLSLMRDLADDVGRGNPHIIWARFQRDIDLISAAMLGDGFVVATYDGRTSPADREYARRGFQDGTIDKFIANPAAAGEGLTLTASERSSYYSNNFSLVQRLQSEDRNHRIGTTGSVLYDDLAAEGTVDLHIIGSLRNNMDVASKVTGDALKEWLI